MDHESETLRWSDLKRGGPQLKVQIVEESPLVLLADKPRQIAVTFLQVDLKLNKLSVSEIDPREM